MTDTQADTHATLKRYTDAWAAGDGATVFAAYGDDMILHYFGQNPFAGIHRGKPDAMAAIREVSRRCRRKLVKIVAIMTGEGGHGCVIVRETVTPDGAEPIEIERAMLYVVAGDQIRECWVYDQDQALIDRLINAA